MTSENLMFLALGVGGAYLLFKGGKGSPQAADASGTDVNTGLPDNAGGAAPNADNARQTLNQNDPGILGPGLGKMRPIDVVGTYQSMYGFGMGNDTRRQYPPVSIGKYQPYQEDKFNSAADNNGGMVIGSGYR